MCLILPRLSEQISLKLADNNPNIADLSDVNRPTNLAEKISLLYDDEWTEAFDALQEIPEFQDEETAIKQLLEMLKVCKAFQVFDKLFRHNEICLVHLNWFVWPTVFLLNVSTALKETHAYISIGIVEPTLQEMCCEFWLSRERCYNKSARWSGDKNR